MPYVTQYPLNLFPKVENKVIFSKLRGEAFLRAGAQAALKILWQSVDQQQLPEDFFSTSFILSLLKDQHAFPIFYRALLKSNDPFFLRAARLEIQDCFIRLMETLKKTPPKTEADLEKVEFCIHNMLAIFVMFNPSPYESIHIPQYFNDEWQIEEFSITPIELSPKHGFFAWFLGEKDRLFSYGLTPKSNAHLPRILVHRGTGWSTSPGIILQVLADLWPNKTPGEIFIEWQHENINHWIDEQKSPVITCGQSLGGSLAYLTAMHRIDKVSKSYCLVPPGMAKEFDENHPLFGNWYKSCKPTSNTILVQRPNGDPISKFGLFPKDFTLKNINAHNETKLPSPFSGLFAHARNVSACDNNITEDKAIEVENVAPARRANNSWLYENRAIIFYGFLVPYYVIRQPINYLLDNYGLRLFTVIALTLCLAFPPFAAAISNISIISLLTDSILAHAVVIFLSSHYLSKTISFSLDLCLDSARECKAYFLDLKTRGLLAGPKKCAFDIANFLLGDAPKIITDFCQGMARLFKPNKLKSEANINSQSYLQTTDNLNAHPLPSYDEKLQSLSIVILFYLIALPIKTICFDMPKFLMCRITSYFFHATNNEPQVELPMVLTTIEQDLPPSETAANKKTTQAPYQSFLKDKLSNSKNKFNTKNADEFDIAHAPENHVV